MKNTKTKLLSIIVFSIAFISLFSCEDIDLFNAKKCYRLELSQSEIKTDIAKGENFTITARTYQKNGSERKNTDMVWSFSQPDCINILYDGSDTITFKVIKPGEIILTAYDSSDSSISKAVIISATGTLRSINLSETNITLNQKESKDIYISFEPEAANDKNVTIKILNSEIVSAVESNHTLTITANRPGQTSVIVKSTSNPDISRSCTVSVKELQIPTTEPKYIKISNSYLKLEDITKTGRLSASIFDGYNQEIAGNIKWVSSNDSIASVSPSSGASVSISPKGIGTCTITAILDSNPDIIDTAKIVVGDESPELQKLIIEKISSSSPMKAKAFSATSIDSVSSNSFPLNSSAIFKVSYFPEKTTQTGFTYNTTGLDFKVEKDGNYLKVDFPKTGSGRINVISTANIGISSSIDISVYDPSENPDNSISLIAINPSFIQLRAGETAEFTASAYNHNGTAIKTDLKWNINQKDGIELLSTNDSVARVKAITDGEYNLEAYAVQNPGIKGNAVINVSSQDLPELQGLVPSSERISIIENNSSEISVSPIPSFADLGTVEWTCEPNGIVELIPSSNGTSLEIKALATGNTTITGTISNDNGKDFSCTIDINVLPASTSTIPKISTIRLEDPVIVFEPPYLDSPKGIMVYSEDASGNQINDTYEWTILDESIIKGEPISSLENQYLLYPLQPGETEVYIVSKTDPNISVRCYVSVKGKLEGIILSPSSLVLDQGGKATVNATLSPTQLHDSYKDIKWSLVDNQQNSVIIEESDEYKVLVSGISKGNTILRAISVKDPTVFADCKIKVSENIMPTENLPSRIELSEEAITINPPKTDTIIEAEVYSTNGSIYPRGVNWEVEDDTIISISTSSEDKIAIEPLRAGSTRITARSIVNPSIIATCIVTVTGQITGISPESMNVTIIKGESYALKVGLKPTNTIETALEYTAQPITTEDGKEISIVSLTQVDSADYQGVLIKGEETGITTLNIKSKIRPSISANVSITVVDPPRASATISISPSAIELSPEDTRKPIKASLVLGNDSPSIDESIAFRIDPVGLVDVTEGATNEIYIIPNGTAGEGTIYAYLPSYPYIEEAKARLFVGGQLRSLVAEGEQSVAVNVGEVATVKVSYNPSNTTETGIIWTSSNESVARVNGGYAKEAIVTGVSSGVATITATSVYYPDKKIEFTVVVKSIINEVAFTDQFGNQGLTFYTDTTTPLTLSCEISPNIEKKLIYKPKSANIGSLSILQPIAGTVNDVEFLPDSGAGAGVFEFNVTYNNKVIDVLTINCTYKGLGISSAREVFSRDYQSTQLLLTSDSGEIASDQIEWESSNKDVATVDNNGIVQARGPGVAVITATIKVTKEKLTTAVYVNVDIPESFEEALRKTGYLEFDGDTVLPEDLEKITELDLRNIPRDLSVDLSGLRKLPNIEVLKISGISLASSELSLSGLSKLRVLEANDCELTRISAIPNSMEEVYAKNNLISSYSSFVNNEIKLRILDLSSNRITNYSDLLYAEKVYLQGNQISYLRVNSSRLQHLDVSSNQITSVTVNAPELRFLNLNSNKLNYSSFTNNDGKSISAKNLEYLYLANNILGLYANKDCPTCSGKRQSANESTYKESESQNREQPLSDIRIDSFPNLKEINLQNNHIRSGLNDYDKSFLFRIYSPKLEKVSIQGNHIGNYYQFSNGNGTISSLPSGAAYNSCGMTVNYDRGGCFYTGQTWHNGWWLLGWHDRYMEYWLGTAYLY